MAIDKKNVQAILSDALAAVEGSGVPDDLRPLAFEKAVDLLAGATKPAEVPQSAATTQGGGEQSAGVSGSGDERLDKIAKRMGVDSAALAYLYDLDDEDVTLIVKRSALTSDKANATREVALLYCAARQAGGYDASHTPVSAIRKKADDMGVLDAANFATQLKNADGFAVKGATAQTREFKVTQHGYEVAGKLVAQITGSGS